MKVGIIGCGLIGGKRAAAVHAPHEITGLCDVKKDAAERLAAKIGKPGIFITDSYEDLILHSGADIIVVATIVKTLAPITFFAVQHGKHVIVEKPAARSAAELAPVLAAAKEHGVIVKVGFNHRYHPALLKAKEIMDTEAEKVGPVMFIRGRYGHGGRVGYDREWRANPELSGGGELIDQGVHLIDLSRWFMGDFETVDGFAATYFWDMPVDDNGFISLRKADGRAAWLQVSCTEWKNMFSFEIYCKNAKLMIDGLGGSYGTERLSRYQMLPEMGPPETTIYEYPRGENSWELEFQEVVRAIETGGKLSMGDISDAYEALRVVDAIYAKGKETGRQ